MPVLLGWENLYPPLIVAVPLLPIILTLSAAHFQIDPPSNKTRRYLLHKGGGKKPRKNSSNIILLGFYLR
jgi:hypothetical protein